MTKYSFENDYSEGCHPKILEKLTTSTFEQQDGYGDDEYSKEAAILIKTKLKNPGASVFFVTGGTQANLIVISAILRPHESVICAHTGHIHTHEAGSIEAVGHKINAINSPDGKVRVTDIQAVLDEHITIPHMVKPKMVYISNASEVGTIYQKEELEALSAYCKKNDLYLFMDGARLGAALCANNNDNTWEDIAKFTDIFYIGGTKNGALSGEAIVINKPKLAIDFGYHLKQKGALTAKGRLQGIQFLALFEDNLFFELAQHANTMAMKITHAIEKKGYPFLTYSTTNQIFPILPNHVIDKLWKKYRFYVWQKIDSKHSAVRIVTSWATKETAVDGFIKDLLEL